MKVNIFNISKYNESILRLQKRNAPQYIIEAYHLGFIDVINEYYKNKYMKNKKEILDEAALTELTRLAETSKLNFVRQALTEGNTQFLKQFLQMTNIDIFTGQRLPKDYSKMMKAGFKAASDSFKGVLNKIK